MTTVKDLQAVFSHLVERQVPDVASLPAGTSLSDWIRTQKIVAATVETSTGKIIGFDHTGALAAFAKSTRAGNPQYSRGSSLRSFITRLISEIVILKRGRADGPIQLEELTYLQNRLATWFASVAIPQKHLIPCSILPEPATTFSIGPVQFLHGATFDPATFGVPPDMSDLFLGSLWRSMNERAASWFAIVEVDACEPDRSKELAALGVDVALAALQLVIGLNYGARMARITGRTLPPYTASLVYSLAGISPEITNNQPGLGLSGAAFDQLVRGNAHFLSSAGDRINTLLTGVGTLTKLQMAWCDAAFWFHEALAEPLDTVAIAKFETSIENLFAAGNPSQSKARILRALRGIFGLSGRDPIALSSLVTVKDFVGDVITARSRVLHGTWSTLTDEVPLERRDVAALAHSLLATYTLMLDAYGQTAASVDKAEAFLDWMEAERAAQGVAIPAAATAHPANGGDVSDPA
jgi:hypothetical protein